MKIASISLKSILGKVDENYKNAIKQIEKSIQHNPDVIMLPELFNTAFFPKDIKSCAENNGEIVKEKMGYLAKKYNVNIIAGSIANNVNNQIYNTSFIFDRNGKNIASYSKIHLFTNMHEDDYFSSGSEIVTFMLDEKKCGIIICYDLRFVELARTLALKEIDILFIVSSWPQSRLFHLHTLSIARAIENQLFVALCNASSEVDSVKFAGKSIIINPMGEILAQSKEDNDIVIANCDFSQLRMIRKNINVFQDRKVHLYDMNLK